MSHRVRILTCVVGALAGVPAALIAQTPSPVAGDSTIAAYQSQSQRLIRAATADSAAHVRLAKLVDTFGHRLSGSASLEAAIDWILQQMKSDGLQNVRGERVMVPHWVRGAESAILLQPRKVPIPVRLPDGLSRTASR